MKKGVMFFGVLIGCFLVLAFLDWVILPRLLGLTEDTCYYHNHEASWLIDWFFIDNSGHTEPPFSSWNILFLLSFTVGTSFLITRKIISKPKQEPLLPTPVAVAQLWGRILKTGFIA